MVRIVTKYDIIKFFKFDIFVFPVSDIRGDPQYLAWLIQLDHWMREYRVIIA